jgi:hypothetical protein
MDLKLTVVFILIATIISLSRLSRENPTKLESKFDSQHWRSMLPRRHKS